MGEKIEKKILCNTEDNNLEKRLSNGRVIG